MFYVLAFYVIFLIYCQGVYLLSSMQEEALLQASLSPQSGIWGMSTVQCLQPRHEAPLAISLHGPYFGLLSSTIKESTVMISLAAHWVILLYWCEIILGWIHCFVLKTNMGLFSLLQLYVMWYIPFVFFICSVLETAEKNKIGIIKI